MAKIKNKKNLDNSREKLIVVTLLIVIVASLVAGFWILNSKNNKSSSTGIVIDDFYSDDTCRCLKRELNKCSEGYELQGTLCVNNTLGTYTNVVKGCSKYECSGIIYEYNFETKFWEAK